MRPAHHDTAPGVQSALAGLQLLPELLTTPELRAIQAQRLVIARRHALIRELLDELHAVRCAQLDAPLSALPGLRRREAEFVARLHELGFHV